MNTGPEYPDLEFRMTDDGLVEKAFCEECGHEFTPLDTQAAVLENFIAGAEGSSHFQNGCDSSTASSFTGLGTEEDD